MTRIDDNPEIARRMRRALEFLDQHFQGQPCLAQVAESVHRSEYHFQRRFKRWVGIRPKRYLQYLTADHAATLLRADASTLEATYESGRLGGYGWGRPRQRVMLAVECARNAP